MPRRSFITFAALALSLGCSGSGDSTPDTSSAASTPASSSSLENPSPHALTERAPDTVRVRFETSKGPFTVEAYRNWAPNGVDRFYQLAKMGYFDDVRFFRVINGFMAQFGLHGNPRVWNAWRDRAIPDDPVAQSNRRGAVTFAARAQPNSRSAQLFINYRDNSNLDAMGFAPIGMVVEGMNVVDSLYSEYGEGAPDGAGPAQERAGAEGNEYLKREFPKLDYIVKATVVGGAR